MHVKILKNLFPTKYNCEKKDLEADCDACIRKDEQKIIRAISYLKYSSLTLSVSLSLFVTLHSAATRQKNIRGVFGSISEGRRGLYV